MSAKPVPRPASPRPASPRAVMPRHRGQSVGDTLLIVAGCIILIGVGYVAYRTQVVGEPIEKVIPFLSGNKELAENPNAQPGSAGATPTSGGTAGRKPAGTADKPAPADGTDSDNTYFGRRIHPSSGSPKPAPSN